MRVAGRTLVDADTGTQVENEDSHTFDCIREGGGSLCVTLLTKQYGNMQCL